MMKCLLLFTCLVALVLRSVTGNEHCDAGSGCLGEVKIISSRLKDLSEQLTSDQDIQSKINSLATKGDEISTQFTHAVSKEGSEILKQKERLMAAVSARGVNVIDMRDALEAGRTAFASVGNKVRGTQTDVHSIIETTRGRREEHERTYAKKKGSLYIIQDEINGYDERIQTLESDARDLHSDAAVLDRRANEIQNAAKKKKKKGIFKAVLGAVLAPFTGGLSLAIGGASAGINLNNAHDCSRKAREARETASAKRQQANTLRDQGKGLGSQKASLLSELEGIHKHTVQLEDASLALDGVTKSLLSFLPKLDEVMNALVNMDTALMDTMAQDESYKIIQNAFASKPEKLGAVSQKYLEQLKNKWLNLETVLTTYGAHA